MEIFPILNSIIFILIAILHLYWAFGGQWGSEHVIPKIEGKATFEPGPLATLIVAGGLLAFAAIHLMAINLFSIGMENYLSLAIGVIAGIFLLRSIGDFKYVGIFKKVKDSSFATYDTKFYVPLCMLIAMNALLTYYYY